ncbi:MAG: hypothetical protein Q8O55_01455 [Dehalococcoidales bacterium]|nr:hypothetical protein [Dehalococcoidales bacterium]
MAWISEAASPEAWNTIFFSPVMSNGNVYITGWETVSFYRYNVGTKVWTVLADPPAQIWGAISLSPDGTRLTAHGINGSVLYIYNIAGNSWTSSSAAPVFVATGGSADIQVTVWYDNDTIWCHAREGGGTTRNKCYRYVISTDTWTQFASVYVLGPGNNSGGMSINTALTALYFGKVHAGADRHHGVKYVIATDTYSQIMVTSGFVYNYASDRNARLWVLDELNSFLGTRYFDCDAEVTVVSLFADDAARTRNAQLVASGFYALSLMIAHHMNAEPKIRSDGTYPIYPPSVITVNATEVS